MKKFCIVETPSVQVCILTVWSESDIYSVLHYSRRYALVRIIQAPGRCQNVDICSVKVPFRFA